MTSSTPSSSSNWASRRHLGLRRRRGRVAQHDACLRPSAAARSRTVAATQARTSASVQRAEMLADLVGRLASGGGVLPGEFPATGETAPGPGRGGGGAPGRAAPLGRPGRRAKSGWSSGERSKDRPTTCLRTAGESPGGPAVGPALSQGALPCPLPGRGRQPPAAAGPLPRGRRAPARAAPGAPRGRRSPRSRPAARDSPRCAPGRRPALAPPGRSARPAGRCSLRPPGEVDPDAADRLDHRRPCDSVAPSSRREAARGSPRTSPR